MAIQHCPMHQQNPPGAIYCGYCGRPLVPIPPSQTIVVSIPKKALGIGICVLIVLVVVFSIVNAITQSQIANRPPTPAPQAPNTPGAPIVSATTPVFEPTQSNQIPNAIPSPTPNPPPAPGTVLYRADQSWSGWGGSADWKVFQGKLTNTGTGNPGNPGIFAPYELGTVTDYAVVVGIQVVRYWSNWGGYAIMLRAVSSGNQQGYSAGVNIPYTADISADMTTFGVQIGSTSYNPGLSFHTFRAEVKGNNIKLFIDGGIKVDATDTTDTTGGQAGLWCTNVQLNITSFEIIAL